MPDGLRERIAVVTGAGRGIGRATALYLAQRGVKVVVNDPGFSADGAVRSDAPALEVVEQIQKAGGTAVANTASVADWDGARSIVEMAVRSFGGLDILVNVAGLSGSRPLQDLEKQEFDTIVGASLTGTFHCTRHAVPHMVAQKRGRIVNFVSRAGLVGIPGATAYAAAKGGVFGFTNAVAQELRPSGVLVNAVNPAATETRMVMGQTPIGSSEDQERRRRMQAVVQHPDHVAAVTAYLCSDICDVSGQYYLVERRGISLLGPISPIESSTLSDDEWDLPSVAQRIRAMKVADVANVY